MSTPLTVPSDIRPSLDAFRADGAYLGADHSRNERRTRVVAGVCLAVLAAQLAGGAAFRSVALLAGGLHMGAHVAALTVAAAAYALARRYATDPRFAFGAGKIGYLAGFANAVVLAVTAVLIAIESVHRLLAPEPVDYAGALALSAGALAVNLVCVWLLKPAHSHPHDEAGDLNLSAAHLHLTGDAVMSALTLAGLAGGMWLGWSWADPVAALGGAALVGRFAWTLSVQAGASLLDINPSPALSAEVRSRLEATGASVLDLHLWRLGPGHHAAIVVLEAPDSWPVNQYHARLKGLEGLSHVTIEVRGPSAT